MSFEAALDRYIRLHNLLTKAILAMTVFLVAGYVVGVPSYRGYCHAIPGVFDYTARCVWNNTLNPDGSTTFNCKGMTELHYMCREIQKWR